MNYREMLKDKKRIVVKVGSSSLIHKETNKLDLRKLEVLVRELSDLHNQGKDVVLVTSGAVAVGASALGFHGKPAELKQKQACSAVGQAKLMMIYQKLFAEYNQVAAQILMTKSTMVNNLNRRNARNTFEELLNVGAIPIVNENDSVSSYELEMMESFGDNDTLSAVITGLIGADLLILLSDIDGLFTDDPNSNPDAEFIHVVEKLDEKLLSMGKGPKSKVGTGGMATKLTAAEIATAAGADMVIANGADFHIIHKIVEGRDYGTLFVSAQIANLEVGDTIFFIADNEAKAAEYAGQIRTKLGEMFDLLEKNAYRFCFINDFPMFEYKEEEKKIGFTHNPFSMPQGGLDALENEDPLTILAYQYDIVCNGVELSSGAVRNHDIDIMKKAFEIAGYDEEVLKEKFGALYTAFQFGAPPHAGMAPGIDRMIMLLRNEDNIREIIAFPMDGKAQDLMCGAPNEITEQQLREVHIKLRK